MDGFGNFLYALSKGAKANTVEPLVFWVLADGDSVNDYARIVSTGGQPHAGSLFAVKVAADGPGAFIGGGKEVPLPGTLGLLGLGIGALEQGDTDLRVGHAVEHEVAAVEIGRAHV